MGLLRARAASIIFIVVESTDSLPLDKSSCKRDEAKSCSYSQQTLMSRSRVLGKDIGQPVASIQPVSEFVLFFWFLAFSFFGPSPSFWLSTFISSWWSRQELSRRHIFLYSSVCALTLEVVASSRSCVRAWHLCLNLDYSCSGLCDTRWLHLLHMK